MMRSLPDVHPLLEYNWFMLTASKANKTPLGICVHWLKSLSGQLKSVFSIAQRIASVSVGLAAEIVGVIP